MWLIIVNHLGLRAPYALVRDKINNKIEKNLVQERNLLMGLTIQKDICFLV